MITCPHCRTENQDGRTFCRKCGGKLKNEKEAEAHCIACGRPLKPDAKSCDRCGTPRSAPKSRVAAFFSRKGRPAQGPTRPSQADIETIMVIEDRPPSRTKNARDSGHQSLAAKPSEAGLKIDPGTGGFSRSTASASATPKKRELGRSSAKDGGRRNPLVAASVAAASIAALAIGIYLLTQERSQVRSTPPTEISVPAETTAQSLTSATTAAQSLPEVLVQEPLPAALQTIVPDSPSVTSSSAPVAPEASPPPTGRAKLRTAPSETSKSAANATEQRRAHKQAEEALKELLKQE